MRRAHPRLGLAPLAFFRYHVEHLRTQVWSLSLSSPHFSGCSFAQAKTSNRSNSAFNHRFRGKTTPGWVPTTPPQTKERFLVKHGRLDSREDHACKNPPSRQETLGRLGRVYFTYTLFSRYFPSTPIPGHSPSGTTSLHLLTGLSRAEQGFGLKGFIKALWLPLHRSTRRSDLLVKVLARSHQWFSENLTGKQPAEAAMEIAMKSKLM